MLSHGLPLVAEQRTRGPWSARLHRRSGHQHDVRLRHGRRPNHHNVKLDFAMACDCDFMSAACSYGKNFAAPVAVFVNNAACAPVTNLAAGSMRCTLPSGGPAF